jgi:hypothetical protein
MASLAQRGLVCHRRRVIANAVKAIVTTQPSGVTGPSPHPKRRGPNHAFRPTIGDVRTMRCIPTQGYQPHKLGPARLARERSPERGVMPSMLAG